MVTIDGWVCELESEGERKREKKRDKERDRKKEREKERDKKGVIGRGRHNMQKEV